MGLVIFDGGSIPGELGRILLVIGGRNGMRVELAPGMLHLFFMVHISVV